MPIVFKSALSSQIANETWLDKTVDDAKKGKFSLYKSVPTDPDAIDDVQDFINELAEIDGVVGENDPNAKTYSSEEIIANGDDRKTAIGKLDAQAKQNLDDIEEINTSIGQANGICPLNASSLIDSVYLPSYVDDVEEYADLASFPVTGETGKIYVALDTNYIYRWSGSTYIEIGTGDSLKRSAGDFVTFTEKTEPVDDDIVLIEDSEDSNSKKTVKLSNLLGGGSTVDYEQETPTGTVDGVNQNFTLSFTPVSDKSVCVYVNGLIKRQGIDYSIAGTFIAFAVAPVLGQTIYVTYDKGIIE